MYLNQIGNYWSDRSEGYFLSIKEQLAGEDGVFWRDILKRHAPVTENITCLDIGCGPGFFSTLLAQMGFDVYAVDYSDGMIEKAKNTFKEQGVKVDLRQGNAENLPFEDGCFDYIVSRNLVWNLENPELAYQEWYRLLSPGGWLLVADANYYLHCHDEEYLAADNATYGQSHRCLMGVDTQRMSDIAKELPLSFKRRPYWDIERLVDTGFDDVRIEVNRKHYTHPDTGEEKSLVYDFIICAEKAPRS